EGPEAAIIARAGQRHLELDAADDLDLPAQRYIVDRVAPRPERAGIVAPDRADAPGVVVLERGIVIVAVSAAIAEVEVEGQCVVLGHRREILVAVAQAVIVGVAAGQRGLEAGDLVAAAR